MLFRRRKGPTVDLSGLGDKELYFVKALTWAYRLTILAGFYLLFYAVMGGLSMLEMATVLVAGVTIIVGSRQAAVYVALWATRMRHGEMSTEERLAVSERLAPPSQSEEGDPDQSGGGSKAP